MCRSYTIAVMSRIQPSWSLLQHLVCKLRGRASFAGHGNAAFSRSQTRLNAINVAPPQRAIRFHSASSRDETGSVIRLELKDLAGVRSVAKTLAHHVQPGDVLCLHGTLGVGKTAFAREFLQARSGDPNLRVQSPTYTLDILHTINGTRFHHFDLYRLTGSRRDLELVGVPEALKNDVCLIEWPDRLGELTPSSRLDVILSHPELAPDATWDDEAESRLLELSPHGERWTTLLSQLSSELSVASSVSNLEETCDETQQ